MAKTLLLALMLAILTGPAYAADKITLTCTGVQRIRGMESRPLHVTNEPLFIDLEGKLVTGFLGELSMDTITEVSISFHGGKMSDDNNTVGMLNRYSGAATIVKVIEGHEYNYSLTCKPAKPLF